MRDPGLANVGDVARLLADVGVTGPRARDLIFPALERGISPRTMWVWAQRFGTDGLIATLGAGVRHAEMLEHLIAGTAPDFRDLHVLAELAR
jgi:hypothetical protein